MFQIQEINGWPLFQLIFYIGQYMYTWSVLVIRSVDESCLCDQGCIEYLNLPKRTTVSVNTLVFVKVYHIHWSVYMEEISIFILMFVFLTNSFQFSNPMYSNITDEWCSNKMQICNRFQRTEFLVIICQISLFAQHRLIVFRTTTPNVYW